MYYNYKYVYPNDTRNYKLWQRADSGLRCQNHQYMLYNTSNNEILMQTRRLSTIDCSRNPKQIDNLPIWENGETVSVRDFSDV